MSIKGKIITTTVKFCTRLLNR